MYKSKSLLVALAMASSGLAYAECSIDLQYPQLVDCIVEEGASDRYRPVEDKIEEASNKS